MKNTFETIMRPIIICLSIVLIFIIGLNAFVPTPTTVPIQIVTPEPTPIVVTAPFPSTPVPSPYVLKMPPIPIEPPTGFGRLNPAVTQDTIGKTICVSGWTATVRPPTSYTNKIKYKLLAQVGLPIASSTAFELDHFLNLGLGGSPTDPNNLWLEAWDETVNGENLGARTKDRVEVYLQRQVCNGKMTLSEAQNLILSDWVKVYESIK